MNAVDFSALPDVQRMSVTAAAYKVLGALAPSAFDGPSALGGRLLLCAGMGEQGFAHSLAMSIAGATFLGIEQRPQRLKEALRDGVCDYMVNSLDEALRVLKNEIRKKEAVSVGLLGEVSILLREASERGVQPEYVVAGAPAFSDATMFEPFLTRGSILVKSADSPVEPGNLVVASAASSTTLRVFERAVATVLAGSTASQLKWAQSSARYFRRTTPPMRSALLDEQQTAAVQNEMSQHPLEGDLTLAVQSGTDHQWSLQVFNALHGAA